MKTAPQEFVGALRQDVEETDYTLRPGRRSCWITVDNISVYIVRTDEGVVVDLFPRFRENDESIGSTYAFNAEAEPDEDNHSPKPD